SDSSGEKVDHPKTNPVQDSFASDNIISNVGQREIIRSTESGDQSPLVLGEVGGPGDKYGEIQEFVGMAEPTLSNVANHVEDEGRNRMEMEECHIEREFLPFNYVSTMYQQLHNLRQGTRSVDEYTHDFYRLLNRVKLRDTQAQLVSRYVSGFRVGIRDMLNMFAPESVSAAHHRALLIEQQQRGRPVPPAGFQSRPYLPASSAVGSPRPAASGGQQLGRTGAPGSSSFSAGGASSSQAAGFGLSQASEVARSGGGQRCFSCGEADHRLSACPRRGGYRALVADFDGEGAAGVVYDGPPVFDEEPEPLEEHLLGDVGPALVLRRSCFSPRTTPEDSLQRHNLFESTCTVGGKVCRFIIDTGSCENVVAQEAVDRLKLSTEPHPHPYTLAWIQRGNSITVDHRVLVQFSIGPKFRDTVWCDVVPMDACHLLLGRPWLSTVRSSMTGARTLTAFCLRAL
ncbi:F-box associated ubiquitination effector family protein, partial [Striga hermonthica]